VAENRNTNRSFVLLKEEVLLSRKAGEAQAQAAGKVHSGRSRKGEELAGGGAVAYIVGGGAILYVGPALVASMPLFLIGAHSMAKATVVKQALVKNELRTETLSPGQAVHGFLYFPVKRGIERIGDLAVRLAVLSVPENEKTTFEFSLPDVE